MYVVDSIMHGTIIKDTVLFILRTTRSKRRNYFYCSLLYIKFQVFQNAQHPIRLQSSASPLGEPQIRNKSVVFQYTVR